MAETYVALAELMKALPAPEEIHFSARHAESLYIEFFSTADMLAWVEAWQGDVHTLDKAHKDTIQSGAWATFRGWRVFLSVCLRVPNWQPPADLDAEIAARSAAYERDNPETGVPIPSGVEGHSVGREAAEAADHPFRADNLANGFPADFMCGCAKGDLLGPCPHVDREAGETEGPEVLDA